MYNIYIQNNYLCHFCFFSCNYSQFLLFFTSFIFKMINSWPLTLYTIHIYIYFHLQTTLKNIFNFIFNARKCFYNLSEETLNSPANKETWPLKTFNHSLYHLFIVIQSIFSPSIVTIVTLTLHMFALDNARVKRYYTYIHNISIPCV